jgi:hypothetical protein
VSLAPSKLTWIAAVAAIVASIPLAFTFVWAEVYAAMLSAPIELGVLAIVGIVLAFVGASLPFQFNLLRPRANGQAGRYLIAAVGGLLFGVVAAGVGFLAAEFSLWALLLWFLVGSFVVAAQSLLLGRRNHDG